MKSNLFLGITLSLFGAFLYSCLTAIIKAQHDSMPPMPMVIFMQSAVPLLIMLPFIFKKGSLYTRQLLTTSRLSLHMVRAIVSLSLTFLLFSSMKFIPLVNTLLLANTSPLIVPFLGYFFLAQRINHQLWVPMLVGFAGVAVVLHPDGQMFNVGAFLALGAAVCMGGSIVAVRKLSQTDSSETTTFYFFLFSSILSGVVALFYWQPVTLVMWGIMILIGVMYLVLQYATTIALKLINAQLVSILFYSNIIFATILSWLIWGSLPSVLTGLGIVLIVMGGIWCIRIEHQAERANSFQIAADAV